MRLFTSCIVAVFLTGGMASSSKADIDYRCLADCVHKSETATMCMPQCTYGEKLPLNEDASSLVHSSASPLAAPTPAGNIIFPRSYAGADSVGKDYQCVTECQH